MVADACGWKVNVANNWFAPAGDELAPRAMVAPISATAAGLAMSKGRTGAEFGSVKDVPKVRAVTLNALFSVALFDCRTAENPQPRSDVVDAQSEA